MLIAGAALLLFAATPATAAEPAPGAPSVGPSAPLPFSPSSVMERVRSRFTLEGDSLTARGNGFEVRAEGGVLEVGTPMWRGSLSIHFDRAEVGGRRRSILAPACPHLDGNRLELDRGLVIERITVLPNSAEQSWVLRTPLRSGLSLFGTVRGMAFERSDEHGLHFVDRESGARIRYGNVTVVDARGRTLPVPVRFEGGAIRVDVPAPFLESADYPVTIDPQIGPETSVGNPVIGAAAFGQTTPAVSFDGTNYLVVWLGGNLSNWTEVWGARVSKAGAVLDPDGVLLAKCLPYGSVATAFDGTNHFVVFDSLRSGQVDAVRVTPGGVALDSTPIAVTTSTASNHGGPQVAKLGSNVLVVWTQSTRFVFDTHVFGARVTAAGSVLDPSGIPIAALAGTRQSGAKLAADPTTSVALVAWADFRNGMSNPDIFGARVDDTGAVLDPTGVAISMASGYQSTPTVAVNTAGRWLVAWVDSRNSGEGDIYGARLDVVGGALSLLDATGFAVNTAPHSQRSPVAASDGTNFLVGWQDNRSDPTSGGNEIWAARPQANGTVLPDSTVGFPVSTAPWDQLTPAVAFDGVNFLAVWADFRNLATLIDIYGTRLPSSGTSVLDLDGFPVAIGGAKFVYPPVWSPRGSTARQEGSRLSRRAR